MRTRSLGVMFGYLIDSVAVAVIFCGAALGVATWFFTRWMIALPFGLGAYVYTGSLGVAHEAAKSIESGMVSITPHGLALPEVPFGGVKDSGYGSEGGSEAIESYLNTKFITHQTGF